MSDPREQILERLATLAATVTGINTVRRNIVQFDEMDLPAIGILEGDEEADDSDARRGRPSNRQYLVTMQPQIFLRDAENVIGIGTRLNALRASLIQAVLADADLNALTVNGNMVRYVSATSTLAAGRSMMGATVVVFAITYRLLPDAL